MPEGNYFERLGLPRRFDLSANEIERQYLLLSRELHPDFHAGGAESEKQASADFSAALNEAYRALRSPYHRGEYLLQLLGGPTAGEVKDIPQDFLMEMLEIREQIDDLKAGEATTELEALESELERRKDALLDRVAALFAVNDEGSDCLLQIRRLLNSAKYIMNLLRDLRD